MNVALDLPLTATRCIRSDMFGFLELVHTEEIKTAQSKKTEKKITSETRQLSFLQVPCILIMLMRTTNKAIYYMLFMSLMSHLRQHSASECNY